MYVKSIYKIYAFIRENKKPQLNFLAKTLFSLLVSIFFFVLVPNTVYATTYYVDATSGSDSANGTSTGTAFQTMAKLSGFGFSAGDQVLLKKGEVWRETWYVNTGGSVGNPITYGSYGTAVAKPRITGTNLVTGWTVESGNVYKANFVNSIDIFLLVENQTTMAIPVGSLGAITSAGKFWFNDATNVVYYWATDGADPDTHTMEIGARYEAVVADDRTDITFDGLQIDGAGGQYGRGFGLKPTWNTPSNITLQNMKITNNYYSGIWMSYATNFTPISNFKIYSSEIDHNGVFGLRIEGQSSSYRPTGFRLDGSHVHHNGLDTASIGQIGVWLSYLSAPTVTGSTLNNNQGFLDWSDNLYTTGTINALVEKNIFYNGYKSNVQFDENSNGFIYRYNISYGAGWNGVMVEEHLRANGTSQIYNNTIYNNLHGFVFGPGTSPTVVSGVSVKNNIFAYNTRASDDLNNTTSDNEVDYNLYYTDDSAQGQFRYNNAFVNFATWKSSTGWDAHSTFAEPAFLNRTSQDFHLTSSSPAINAGVNVGLTSDFIGNTVPYGDASDIGAYEYSLASSTSTINSTSASVSPNSKPGWSYPILAGPNHIGMTNFITGGSGAEDAMAYISDKTHHDDVYLTIDALALNYLATQLKIPYPWSHGWNIASDIYQFNAVSAFNGYPITQFDHPATVILPYYPEKLHGLTPNTLKIGWYDTIAKKWKALPSHTTVIDQKNHTIANTTKNFSYFAVIYPNQNKTPVLGANTETRPGLPAPTPTSTPTFEPKLELTPVPQTQPKKKTCILWWCF